MYSTLLQLVLRVNTRLKELHISYCHIQSSDSVHLAKALEENTTTQLQTLELIGNPIGSEGAVAFADMLVTNKSLDKLDMSICYFQGKGAVCLVKAMEKNSSVTSDYNNHIIHMQRIWSPFIQLQNFTKYTYI